MIKKEMIAMLLADSEKLRWQYQYTTHSHRFSHMAEARLHRRYFDPNPTEYRFRDAVV